MTLSLQTGVLASGRRGAFVTRSSEAVVQEPALLCLLVRKLVLVLRLCVQGKAKGQDRLWLERGGSADEL